MMYIYVDTSHESVRFLIFATNINNLDPMDQSDYLVLENGELLESWHEPNVYESL